MHSPRLVAPTLSIVLRPETLFPEDIFWYLEVRLSRGDADSYNVLLYVPDLYNRCLSSIVDFDPFVCQLKGIQVTFRH